jgi:hypothetical protein
MNKSWAAPALLLMLLTGGCAVEPFIREPLPALKDPNPSAMRDSFSHTVSNHFDSDDTIIIEAPFNHDLEVLGVLRVERPAGTFELIGLNPLAVKFFDLSSDRQGPTIRYAITPLLAHREILLSIAQDIRRMYFDLTPTENAKAEVEPTMVRFTEKTPDGTLLYEFGGDPPVLLGKRLDGFFGTIWRVRYFQYASAGTSLYPRGIVMDNSRFHYRIIVKNRDRTKD